MAATLRQLLNHCFKPMSKLERQPWSPMDAHALLDAAEDKAPVEKITPDRRRTVSDKKDLPQREAADFIREIRENLNKNSR